MALLIQKKSAVVNVLDTTRAAGEQIINIFTTDCLAKPIHKTPENDEMQIFDTAGLPTQSFELDGTLQYQDIGGSPTTWAGTVDELADKLNTEYFNNFRTEGAANLPTHQELTDPSTVVISNFKKLDFVCSGSIDVTLDGNTIQYPYNLTGDKILGESIEADSTSLNSVTFNGTGTVLLTIKQ